MKKLISILILIHSFSYAQVRVGQVFTSTPTFSTLNVTSTSSLSSTKITGTVTATGGLGIGTTTPLNFIDVTDATEPQIQVTRNSNDFAILGKAVGEAYLFSNDNASILSFYTNSQKRMSIAPLGGVTIVGTLSVSSTSSVTNISSVGNLSLTVAGNGLLIKEGTNATLGTATLTSGTVTINTSKVTASSRIIAFIDGAGTIANLGTIYEDKPNRVTGVSFIIKSSNLLSNSSIVWVIVEPL